MYARLSLCACVNENDREEEFYAEMNERNDIYISKSRKKEKKRKQDQFVALGVHSAALRHTLVYRWETLHFPLKGMPVIYPGGMPVLCQLLA